MIRIIKLHSYEQRANKSVLLLLVTNYQTNSSDISSENN